MSSVPSVVISAGARVRHIAGRLLTNAALPVLAAVTVLLLTACTIAPNDPEATNGTTDTLTADSGVPAGPDSLGMDDTTRRAILDVVSQFHDALGAADTSRALELLHDSVLVYESGRAETKREYAAGHLAADIAFLSGVERSTSTEHVLKRDSLALYTSEYTMSGTYDGEPIDARGVESIALVETAAGWRIRHIHWSSR